MLFGRCCQGFVLPLLEYSAADTHRVVSGDIFFLTMGMFEGDIALWQYYVCCTRSKLNVIRWPSLWCCNWAVCASAGYARCFGRTSEHLCASSLQYLAVPQDFYSIFSISVERSLRLRIRWCGTGGFQEQGQCLFIGLELVSFFSPTYVKCSMARSPPSGESSITVRGVHYQLLAVMVPK